MTASGPIVRSEVNETLRPIVPEAKIGRLEGRGGDARPVYLAQVNTSQMPGAASLAVAC
jgi:hypothetical protein